MVVRFLISEVPLYAIDERVAGRVDVTAALRAALHALSLSLSVGAFDFYIGHVSSGENTRINRLQRPSQGGLVLAYGLPILSLP